MMTGWINLFDDSMYHKTGIIKSIQKSGFSFKNSKTPCMESFVAML